MDELIKHIYRAVVIPHQLELLDELHKKFNQLIDIPSEFIDEETRKKHVRELSKQSDVIKNQIQESINGYLGRAIYQLILKHHKERTLKNEN